MYYFAHIRKRTVALLVLYIVLLVVMFNNFSERKDYDDLDRTISSIYNDRLMPAGFLFKLNDHLYQKKITLQAAVLDDKTDFKEIENHNNEIGTLMKDYEKTYLTKNEEEQWETFKAHLTQYNSSEDAFIQTWSQHHSANLRHQDQMKSSFNAALLCLNKLNDIQATEGRILQRHSSEIIGGSILHSYLEISLLFLTAVILLQFTGMANARAAAGAEKALLN